MSTKQRRFTKFHPKDTGDDRAADYVVTSFASIKPTQASHEAVEQLKGGVLQTLTLRYHINARRPTRLPSRFDYVYVRQGVCLEKKIRIVRVRCTTSAALNKNT